ncbi:MAG: hypothetical protein AAGB19_01130 [Cyanobacteria bacterium P01_F01_bin.3]
MYLAPEPEEVDWDASFRAAMFAYHALLEVADMEFDELARDEGVHLQVESIYSKKGVLRLMGLITH